MTYIEISVTFSNFELQAEHSEEKGFQCDAKPVQCVQFVDTYSFKAANSSSMLMRNLTNSSNFRRLSLLPGRICAIISLAKGSPFLKCVVSIWALPKLL